MKRLLVLLLPALMLLASPAFAQNTVAARVVTTCGTPGNTPVVGNAYPLTQDTTLTLCTAGGGGGGGGAVTIANGADATQGAIADAAWSGTGNGTTISILKSIRGLLASPLAVTGTFWQATQPVSGTVTANLGTLNGVSTAALQSSVQETFGATIANNVVVNDAAGNPVDWTAAVPVNLASTTTGGCTPYGYQSGASTNATSVKASAGTLCSLNVINTTATLYYVRLYNLAAAPTCSSATGFVKSIPVPASVTGAGVALSLGAFGEAYTTGVAFCLTGGGSSTDNTNAAAGVYVAASYK